MDLSTKLNFIIACLIFVIIYTVGFNCGNKPIAIVEEVPEEFIVWQTKH